MRQQVQPLLRALPMIALRGSAGGMPVVVGLLIAARWGLRPVGAFTVASAAVTVTVAVSDWGAIRALPRNLVVFAGGAGERFVARTNAVRGVLGVIAVLLLAMISVVAAVPREVAVDYALLLPLVPLSLLANNAVSARVVSGETAGLGGAAVAGAGTFALLAAACWMLDLGPHAMVGAGVVGKVAETSWLASGRWWVAKIRPDAMVATFAVLLPFGAQILLGVIYSRLSVFTLERLETPTSLGVFAVATALQSILLLVPTSLALMHFPELTRLASRGEVKAIRGGLLRYVAAATVGVGGGLVLLGVFVEPIADAFHVPRPLAPFLVVFSGLAYLGVFSTMCGFLLQAWGQESRAARLSLATLLLALAYQVAAVTMWGLWGVVVAVTAAEITSVLIFGLAIRRVWAAA